MIDWHAAAAALDAPISRQDRHSVIVPLEKLERDLERLRERLPFDAPLWQPPRDSE